MAWLSHTPLEAALLERFHLLYAREGFPRPQGITVLARENTDGGRSTALFSPHAVSGGSTFLDLGDDTIEMEGLPHGLSAVVRLEGGRIKALEIVVNGGDRWDGAERAWSLA